MVSAAAGTAALAATACGDGVFAGGDGTCSGCWTVDDFSELRLLSSMRCSNTLLAETAETLAREFVLVDVRRLPTAVKAPLFPVAPLLFRALQVPASDPPAVCGVSVALSGGGGDERGEGCHCGLGEERDSAMGVCRWLAPPPPPPPATKS